MDDVDLLDQPLVKPSKKEQYLPNGIVSPFASRIKPRSTMYIEKDITKQRYCINLFSDSIHPGETIVYKSIFIFSDQNKVSINFIIFGENIPKPISCNLSVNITKKNKKVTQSDLLKY